MCVKAKVLGLAVWFAAAGVGGSSAIADHLPTHGGVLHLDSGPVVVGISPMLFTAYGADGLTSSDGYHWEIHISNLGGLGNEQFNMAIQVDTPTGPITIGAGAANIPPFKGLHFAYHLNPDPFGETAPLAVRMSYTKPRIGLVPMAFHSTITEHTFPPNPPCQDEIPLPPGWIPRAGGEGGGGGEGEPDVVFTLFMPPPGDTNGDGSVDVADYVAWRKSDGSPEGYAAWRTHFGELTGLGAAMEASSNAIALPEPASALLLLFAAAISAGRRRRDASVTVVE
jgi:hypothetical protein